MPIDISSLSVRYDSNKLKTPSIFLGNTNGRITVNVLELGLPDSAEVALYDRRTRGLVQIGRSDSSGLIIFRGINEFREYYIHAIHDDRKFNAVTQDMIPGNYDKLKAKGIL